MESSSGYTEKRHCEQGKWEGWSIRCPAPVIFNKKHAFERREKEEKKKAPNYQSVELLQLK